MLTGIGGAIVDVDFAIRPHKTEGARTLVPVQLINTRSTVLTRIRATFIDIQFATFTCREQISNFKNRQFFKSSSEQ